MYKSAPQANDYALIKKLQYTNRIIFILIILISLLTSITLAEIINFSECIDDIKNIIYIGLMIAFTVISIVIDYNLLPNAQKITRCDFFDHSFGTKYIHQENSEEYYTNQNLENGIFKMAVNLFESSFFTYALSSKMRFKKVINCCLLVAILIPLIFYGFKNTAFIGIVLLQTLLSIYFISGLIRLLIFVNRSRELFEELKSLFSNSDLKDNTEKYFTNIYRIYVDYECNKTWANIQLDSKLYNKLNAELSEAWDEMKCKYKIN